MSLIKCKDCNKDISSEARSCIHCGRLKDSIIKARNAEKNISKTFFWIGAVIIIPGIFIILGITIAFKVPLVGIIFAIIFSFLLRNLWNRIDNA